MPGHDPYRQRRSTGVSDRPQSVSVNQQFLDAAQGQENEASHPGRRRASTSAGRPTYLEVPARAYSRSHRPVMMTRGDSQGSTSSVTHQLGGLTTDDRDRPGSASSSQQGGKRGRRQKGKGLDDETRKHAAYVRGVGACNECRLRKVKCRHRDDGYKRDDGFNDGASSSAPSEARPSCEIGDLEQSPVDAQSDQGNDMSNTSLLGLVGDSGPFRPTGVGMGSTNQSAQASSSFMPPLSDTDATAVLDPHYEDWKLQQIIPIDLSPNTAPVQWPSDISGMGLTEPKYIDGSHQSFSFNRVWVGRWEQEEDAYGGSGTIGTWVCQTDPTSTGCGARFLMQDDLKVHFRTIHQDYGEALAHEVVICSGCNNDVDPYQRHDCFWTPYNVAWHTWLVYDELGVTTSAAFAAGPTSFDGSSGGSGSNSGYGGYGGYGAYGTSGTFSDPWSTASAGSHSYHGGNMYGGGGGNMSMSIATLLKEAVANREARAVADVAHQSKTSSRKDTMHLGPKLRATQREPQHGDDTVFARAQIGIPLHRQVPLQTGSEGPRLAHCDRSATHLSMFDHSRAYPEKNLGVIKVGRWPPTSTWHRRHSFQGDALWNASVVVVSADRATGNLTPDPQYGGQKVFIVLDNELGEGGKASLALALGGKLSSCTPPLPLPTGAPASSTKSSILDKAPSLVKRASQRLSLSRIRRGFANLTRRPNPSPKPAVDGWKDSCFRNDFDQIGLTKPLSNKMISISTIIDDARLLCEIRWIHIELW